MRAAALGLSVGVFILALIALCAPWVKVLGQVRWPGGVPGAFLVLGFFFSIASLVCSILAYTKKTTYQVWHVSGGLQAVAALCFLISWADWVASSGVGCVSNSNVTICGAGFAFTIIAWIFAMPTAFVCFKAGKEDEEEESMSGGFGSGTPPPPATDAPVAEPIQKA